MPRSSGASIAFERRLKRQVIGRRQVFFIATAPGLEGVCLRELKQLPLSSQRFTKLPGGIELEGRLSDCYLANLHLRTASRVLMRIGAFRATHFNRLESKLREIPWELYVGAADNVEVRVKVSRSRLYHSGALSERVDRAAHERLSRIRRRPPPSGDAPGRQLVFLRGEKDRFSVSIDSSGELLHRRGLKTHGGRAPIRETLAAAGLMLAGFNGREPLIDPMCGSGTFSIEAALMAKGIPPGLERPFAFMRWPGFRKTIWNYLKKTAAKAVDPSTVARIFASDTGVDACRRLERCAAANGLTEMMIIQRKNFFDFSPGALTELAGCVVINPPYGRRMGNPRQSEALYLDICAHLRAAYRSWKVCLVAPSEDLARRTPFPLTPLVVPHGGLKIVLLTGRIAD
jgi:putative N6-adenine-specific DNA methylase